MGKFALSHTMTVDCVAAPLWVTQFSPVETNKHVRARAHTHRAGICQVSDRVAASDADSSLL